MKGQKRDAVVRFDLLGEFRCASSLEISRARADNVANFSGAHGHDAAIGQFTNAQSNIDVVFEEMGDRVGEPQLNIDLRISFEKLNNDRCEVQSAEYDRSAHDQFSLGRAIFAGRKAFCFTQFFNKPSTCLKELPAGFCQCNVAR